MSARDRHLPDPGLRRTFQRRLLRWYARHGRDLPWRRTSDPYRILVSEVMLQQTQVERVIPKYEEFLNRYPSIEALASASVRDVEATWRPLGYNIRPVRLHAIAREAMRRHRGRLPDTPEALRALKGIGPYTAGAVMSFAFRKDAPILDTNVRRVLQRVFIGAGEPAAGPSSACGTSPPASFPGERATTSTRP
jgi:A/G-specific adenine glycosylase